MAISNGAIWEFRGTATALNANGGFFIPGSSGVDYSQQNAAQYNLTGASSSGAGNTVLHASAAADMVGNGGHCISGTNFTAGWFEILSVVVGVSITFGTNKAGASICTGVGSAGVINIGGALPLGGTAAGSSDDNLFESFGPGHILYFKKSGTMTVGTSIVVATGTSVGTAAEPIKMIGYNATRGDAPTGTDRPTIDLGLLQMTINVTAFWEYHNIYFDGANIGLVTGNYALIENCKFRNTQAIANRNALSAGNFNTIRNCEMESTNGRAVTLSGPSFIEGCTMHSSATGISIAVTTSGNTVQNNLIKGCTTGILLPVSAAYNVINGNTIYGAETPAGIGIDIPAGCMSTRIYNNIVYGFTTGVSHADAANNTESIYNNIYNCTTPRTNIAAGVGDTTLDPQFTNAAGFDFSIGTNLRSSAMPNLFPGSSTTSYVDKGAVQRYHYPSGYSRGRIVNAGM